MRKGSDGSNISGHSGIDTIPRKNSRQASFGETAIKSGEESTKVGDSSPNTTDQNSRRSSIKNEDFREGYEKPTKSSNEINILSEMVNRLFKEASMKK